MQVNLIKTEIVGNVQFAIIEVDGKYKVHKENILLNTSAQRTQAEKFYQSSIDLYKELI